MQIVVPMDPAILPAVSGHIGSLIGASSALAGGWLNQQTQFRAQLRTPDTA
jgi:hypothetical protein